MSRIYPCVYCTEDGYCNKYSDDEVTSWCVQSPCKDEKPSNADRIRAMSDEELAKLLVRVAGCRDGMTRENAIKLCNKIIHCDTCWLNWLREEASE